MQNGQAFNGRNEEAAGRIWPIKDRDIASDAYIL